MKHHLKNKSLAVVAHGHHAYSGKYELDEKPNPLSPYDRQHDS
ncbi:hypothetical protein [Jeotgalibaca sp. PTS2502]|nr:hypothetical protein [Jeotgalibaca sp. PTS2502]